MNILQRDKSRGEGSADGELAQLRKENEQLKHELAELAERELDIRILKKVTGQMPLTGEGSR